jgi:hypothetical protein
MSTDRAMSWPVRANAPNYYAMRGLEPSAAADPPRSGDVLAAAWQVHWSDASGRLWRNQMVEIRNRREPQRIMVWERAATWGRAEYE